MAQTAGCKQQGGSGVQESMEQQEKKARVKTRALVVGVLDTVAPGSEQAEEPLEQAA